MSDTVEQRAADILKGNEIVPCGPMQAWVIFRRAMTAWYAVGTLK